MNFSEAYGGASMTDLRDIAADASDMHAAYQAILADRSEELLPGDTTLDKDVDDAVKIANTYKRLQTDLVPVRSELEYNRLRLARMAELQKTQQATYAEFQGLLGGMDHQQVRPMVDAMAKFSECAAAVVDAWTTQSTSLCRELQTKEQSIEAELRKIREMLVAGAREIIDPDNVNKKLCPICFENEVTVVCVPCGHTLCTLCSTKTDASTSAKSCHTCRTRVRERIKMFFSV